MDKIRHQPQIELGQPLFQPGNPVLGSQAQSGVLQHQPVFEIQLPPAEKMGMPEPQGEIGASGAGQVLLQAFQRKAGLQR